MSLHDQKFAIEIIPSSFVSYRDYLRELYGYLKKNMHGYSYRKMAEDFTLPPTTIVYQIIKGERKLTAKCGKKIASAIGLKGDERQYFLTMIELNNSRSPQEQERSLKQLLHFKAKNPDGKLSTDQLEFYNEWYHPVIRELVVLPNFSSDPEWIAKSLRPNIRPEQAKKSLELLERLELICFDASLGRYLQTTEKVSTEHEVEGMVMSRYHQTMIDLAKGAVTGADRRLRDISGVTFRVSAKKIEELKNKLYELQMQVLADEESLENCEQIYQLNLQLFPLTQIKQSKENSDE